MVYFIYIPVLVVLSVSLIWLVSERRKILKRYDDLCKDLRITIQNKDLQTERYEKELEQLVHSVSHDLREPLRMVSSFTELLEKKTGQLLNDETVTIMNYIKEGAKRLQDMINGLLEYSRVSSKNRVFEDLNLNEPLNDVVKEMSAIIESTGSEINCKDLPVVSGDRDQLRTVFSKLIDNAVKFRESGRKTKIEISSKVVLENDQVEITVEDNGIGIEEKYHDKVFIMFHRLHSIDRFPGTGAGLPIVKKIIERHGGRIWAESDGPGKGSSIRFTLKKGATNA